MTGTGTPTGSLLSMSNNYTVSGKTTAPNVTGNPNDPGKVALMYGHANLSVAKSHYATGNAGNDASTPDTVITFTNGTPQTGDDEVVMVLEDWTADLTYTQFDLV